MRARALRTAAKVIIAALMIVGFAAGQSASPQSATVDEAKRAKVKEVLALSHALDNTAKLMRESMAKQKRLIPIPAAAQDDFEKMFFEELQPQVFVDAVIPIYADTFTVAELDQLIAFYKSPLGQKMVEKSPELMDRSMSVGSDLGRQAGMKVGAEIDRKLKAGDYGPWPPTDNKTTPTPK